MQVDSYVVIVNLGLDMYLSLNQMDLAHKHINTAGLSRHLMQQIILYELSDKGKKSIKRLQIKENGKKDFAHLSLYESFSSFQPSNKDKTRKKERENNGS